MDLGRCGDDADLLVAVAAGDRWALQVLLERHAGWLHARLLHRCSDQQLVEEAIQDTFVAVWSSADRWRSDGPVAAWLWGIAMRRLTDLLRRHGDDPAIRRTSAIDQRRTVPSAEDVVLAQLQFAPVKAHVDALPPREREVLEAVILDGLTLREAATALGIPPGTAKTRLRTARQRLRRILAR